jgi:hypothetical protein
MGKPLQSSRLTVSKNEKEALKAMVGLTCSSAIYDATALSKPRPIAGLSRLLGLACPALKRQRLKPTEIID